MLDYEIPSDQAWRRDDLSPSKWLVPLPAAAVAELETVAARLRAHPQPVEHLAPGAFPLSTCASVMADARERLLRGPGLAVVDRVPVERYTTEENRAFAWLLARLLGQLVDQKWQGTRVYDVKDSGQALAYGVRRSVTNLDQPFHTDGPWLTHTPAFVGLFCLQSAAEGGMSRLVSLLTAHNELRRRSPHLLPRLYRPFRWDRQAEHGPNDRRFSTHPVFRSEKGVLAARYYEDYVVKGSALAGETLDAEGQDALAAMRAIVDATEHWIEFRVESGQLQYINNRQFAHSRTAFRDPDPAGGRHMLRLWNRDEGAPGLEG